MQLAPQLDLMPGGYSALYPHVPSSGLQGTAAVIPSASLTPDLPLENSAAPAPVGPALSPEETIHAVLSSASAPAEPAPPFTPASEGVDGLPALTFATPVDSHVDAAFPLAGHDGGNVLLAPVSPGPATETLNFDPGEASFASSHHWIEDPFAHGLLV